jgi:hypothetical protein
MSEYEAFDFKSENKANIAIAIDKIVEFAKKNIDFSKNEEFYHLKVPLNIWDAKKNKTECELVFGYWDGFLNNGDKREREMGILVATKGKVEGIDFADRTFYDLQPNDISKRAWMFSFDDKDNSLNVSSKLNTKDQHTELGLGSSLLLLGEKLMEVLAKKLATQFKIEHIKSEIMDFSEREWTKRRIDDLPGYQETNDIAINAPAYRKILSAPFHTK